MVVLSNYWIFNQISSKGPIIIRQDRVGIDGQQFQCMKFRTMVSNKAAEKGYSHLTKKG